MKSPIWRSQTELANARMKELMDAIVLSRKANGPLALFGLFDVDEVLVRSYVGAHGKAYVGRALPDGYDAGPPGECYKNASQLVMTDHSLSFVEGWATLGGDIGMMHAWAVDADGSVVDNTLAHPEKWSYFGVKYDTEKYMAHLERTMVYGVLGGDQKAAAKVVAKGGL